MLFDWKDLGFVVEVQVVGVGGTACGDAECRVLDGLESVD